VVLTLDATWTRRLTTNTGTSPGDLGRFQASIERYQHQHKAHIHVAWLWTLGIIRGW
jgi:hypothetical protein